MIFDTLTNDKLLDKLESPLPEHRECLYSPTQTLSMFLAQALSADRSCQHAVNEWFVARQVAGFSPIGTNTAAYCCARQRLPIQWLRDMTRHCGYELQHQTVQGWTWKGCGVKLVDGKTLSMPDTEENQATYPQAKSQQPGMGFPLCRLVGILDLSTGAVIDMAFGACEGKGSGEQGLLRELLHSSLSNGEVLLGDAFLPSYFPLWTLQEMGVDCLCEQMGGRQASTDFRCGQSSGTRDHLINYKKPKVKPEWLSQADYDAAPETLRVRKFHCKAGKGNQGKTLVTTICCPKRYTKQQLKKLYKQRWQLEINFRHLKTTLGIDVLSCKTTEVVGK